MKRTLLFYLFLISGFVSQAQSWGDFILGGRFNYVGGGRTITEVGRKSLGYTLKFTASPGYFFRNQWSFGANLSYEYMTDSKGYQYTLESLPYLRFYSRGESLRFFLQLESGPAWGQSFLDGGNDGKHFLWISSLKPGLYIRIKENWSSEITISDLTHRSININSGGRQTHYNRWNFQALSISFGMSWIIQR